MSTHTLDEARDRLGELVERALRGEGVIITRDGQPAVELRPFPAAAPLSTGPSPLGVMENWMRDFRRDHPKEVADAVALVREMREEGP